MGVIARRPESVYRITPESIKETEAWLTVQKQSQIAVDAVLKVGAEEKNVTLSTMVGYASDEEKYIMLEPSDCDDARTVTWTSLERCLTSIVESRSVPMISSSDTVEDG